MIFLLAETLRQRKNSYLFALTEAVELKDESREANERLRARDRDRDRDRERDRDRRRL